MILEFRMFNVVFLWLFIKLWWIIVCLKFIIFLSFKLFFGWVNVCDVGLEYYEYGYYIELLLFLLL